MKKTCIHRLPTIVQLASGRVDSESDMFGALRVPLLCDSAWPTYTHINYTQLIQTVSSSSTPGELLPYSKALSSYPHLWSVLPVGNSFLFS